MNVSKAKIFEELENVKDETSCNGDKTEKLLKLLRPLDFNDIPITTRIALLKKCYSDEDLALLLCSDLTDVVKITTFHQSLKTEKVNGVVLLDYLENEFNDIDFIKDDNLSNLSTEFTQQGYHKLGEREAEEIITSNLVQNHVYFWDGVHKSMNQDGSMWFIYYSKVEAGQVKIKHDEWHPNNWSQNKEGQWETYDPLDKWFLIYITKDINGVSLKKESLYLFRLLHYIQLYRGN